MPNSAIAESFKSSYSQMLDTSDPEATRKKEAPSREILDRWFRASDDEEYEQVPASEVDNHSDVSDNDRERSEEGEDSDIPELEEYRRFICGDPGYEWLLDCLRREVTLARPAQDIMGDIRHQILQAIPRTHRVSRKKSPEGCKVTYFVDWQPLAFLSEQDYEDQGAEAIAKAITLTGSWQDAQAFSCRDYLTQTWSLTGRQIMRLIQDLLRDCNAGTKVNRESYFRQKLFGHTEYESHANCLLGKCPNGTRLSAWLVESSLVVEASGVPDFVAEIGEQLAWIGAALRPSSCLHGVACCVPIIERIGTITSTRTDSIHCRVGFNVEEYNGPSSNANGQCWHAMFRRPVIVKGYPIPRRPQADTGLELSLDIMAALACTRYANVFDSKVFIKGFSTILVPTKRLDDDVLVWHLLYNKRPTDRISYLDCSVETLSDVRISELERARHIVGWCSDAVCNVGRCSSLFLPSNVAPWPSHKKEHSLTNSVGI